MDNYFTFTLIKCSECWNIMFGHGNKIVTCREACIKWEACTTACMLNKVDTINFKCAVTKWMIGSILFKGECAVVLAPLNFMNWRPLPMHHYFLELELEALWFGDPYLYEAGVSNQYIRGPNFKVKNLPSFITTSNLNSPCYSLCLNYGDFM